MKNWLLALVIPLILLGCHSAPQPNPGIVQTLKIRQGKEVIVNLKGIPLDHVLTGVVFQVDTETGLLILEYGSSTSREKGRYFVSIDQISAIHHREP